MRVELEDFHTGWYGAFIMMKRAEIDRFINLLTELKKNDEHFHIFSSDYSDEKGLADIEFSILDDDDKENNWQFTGFPIEPNR